MQESTKWEFDSLSSHGFWPLEKPPALCFWTSRLLGRSARIRPGQVRARLYELCGGRFDAATALFPCAFLGLGTMADFD